MERLLTRASDGICHYCTRLKPLTTVKLVQVRRGASPYADFCLIPCRLRQISQLSSFVEAELDYHRQSMDILQGLFEALQQKWDFPLASMSQAWYIAKENHSKDVALLTGVPGQWCRWKQGGKKAGEALKQKMTIFAQCNCGRKLKQEISLCRLLIKCLATNPCLLLRCHTGAGECIQSPTHGACSTPCCLLLQLQQDALALHGHQS